MFLQKAGDPVADDHSDQLCVAKKEITSNYQLNKWASINVHNSEPILNIPIGHIPSWFSLMYTIRRPSLARMRGRRGDSMKAAPKIVLTLHQRVSSSRWRLFSSGTKAEAYWIATTIYIQTTDVVCRLD